MKTQKSRDRADSKRQGETVGNDPRSSAGGGAGSPAALRPMPAWRHAASRVRWPRGKRSMRSATIPCARRCGPSSDRAAMRSWWTRSRPACGTPWRPVTASCSPDTACSGRTAGHLPAGLAEHEMSRQLRAEWRRRKLALVALKETSPHDGMGLARSNRGLAGSLVALAPRGLEFCDEHLLTAAPARPFSGANIWQLIHRIYQRLLRFLNGGS